MGRLTGSEAGSAAFRDRYERLRELSGEKRVGPGGAIYGEMMPLKDRTIRFMAWFAVTMGLLAAVSWLLYGDEPCLGVLYDTEFAGTAERFLDRFETRTHCDLGDVRQVVYFDFFYSIVYTVALGLLLTVWWNASWDAEPGFSRIPSWILAAVAAAALLAETVENIITLFGLGEEGGNIVLRFAPVIFTIAWLKWALVAILVVATGAVFVAWAIRTVRLVYRLARESDEIDYVPPVIPWAPDEEQPNFGICLSGGGIRSAAFSLGALSALEETDVEYPKPGSSSGLLGQADLLASVSGGGYAASAWRLAVGFGEDALRDRPVIGDPNRHGAAPNLNTDAVVSDEAEATHDPLFPRLRDLRDYPRNGRGGLLASAVIVIVQMAWHLLLILAFVGIVAWPLGKLVESWIITTPLETTDGIVDSIEYGRLSIPALSMLGVLGLVLVVRSFTFRGPARRMFDAVSLTVLGLAAMLYTGLVVLPWMVVELVEAADDLIGGRDVSEPALAALLGSGIVASVFRVLQAPIKSRAKYLGGVLLVVGLVWFGLVVASHARDEGRLFTLGWFQWFVIVCILTSLLLFTNPDLWSLHWLYRRRLTESFANRWDPGSQTWEPMATADQPPLSEYVGAPGPKQVICAVAARAERRNTGIPVVSMTFEPDYVTVHCGPDPSDPNRSDSHGVATADYEGLFHGRAWAERHRTVFTAAALSAAAFAPSLGRHNLGTTNALVAALNLRLGVWMPNPMFRRGRRAGPDLFNMFKEIGGSYSLDEANVYVTDGGHWENLALVELIRRRAKHIISVDASMDPELTFSAVLEAIELAELECATKVTFVDDGLAAMRPGEGPRAEKNWCRADISYPDGTSGRLLYVKAQASDHMPLDVLRYSKEDPTFPNYSTADQLLNKAEFSNLSILGRESMIAALDDCHGWLFGAPGQDGDPSGGPGKPRGPIDGPAVAATVSVEPEGGDSIAVAKTPPRRVAPTGVSTAMY